MPFDVLAKSDPDKRNATLGGVLSEDFSNAVRTLQYPLTSEVSFRTIRQLHLGLERLVAREKDQIGKLTIHGHTRTYLDAKNYHVYEFGNDDLHNGSFGLYSEVLKKIGGLMAVNGLVHLLHCSVGRNEPLFTALSKYMNVPVMGELDLNNLGPVFTNFQLAVGVGAGTAKSGEGSIRTGTKTFHPDGTVTTDMRGESVRF